MKRKEIDIATLKVAMITGRISTDRVEALIQESQPDNRINLLKAPIGWYLEEIANEEDVFQLVQKVCKNAGINFLGLSQKTFFAICKAIKEQNEVIGQIISDIQYPELTDIQKEAGYGDKHFGSAGLICNLADAFKISYIEAEKQPVIALTKLRMNAHLATCQENERKLKKMFEKKQ